MDSAPDVSLPQIAFAPILPAGDLLLFVFYLVLGFYVIFTAVLYYHWNAYATDKKVATATYVAYLGITLPLIITMATSALII